MCWKNNGVVCSVLVVLLLAIVSVLYILPKGKVELQEYIWNGKPHIEKKQQVLLWTMMRSGSRMTQELLLSLPCSFLTEEPFRFLRWKGNKYLIQLMKDLFQCRFSRHPKYFSQWVNGPQVNEEKIKSKCVEMPRLCNNTAFVEAMCQAACVRLLRIVSVEMGMADFILQDPAFNVRVVHLVRDPRAMVDSRDRLELMFRESPFLDDEINITAICDRYRRDLSAARFFKHRYPNR